jgi:hypothetical protein
MNKAKLIESVALIAHDQTPEIAQPSEQTLNFPPPSVPAERTAILGFGPGATAPMELLSFLARQTATMAHSSSFSLGESGERTLHLLQTPQELAVA